jgi:hypothetical protein
MLHIPDRQPPAQAPLDAFFLPQGTPPAIIAHLEEVVRDTFDRHGPGAFEASRHAALVHEVGHAIVGTHEGISIRQIAIFSALGEGPNANMRWGGRCTEVGATWTTGPDTTAEQDLGRARFIIAGLAAEALTGLDKPGSSLNELITSQVVGYNAAVKLADPRLSDAAHWEYAERLWHEQVWGVAITILRANREPAEQLAAHLHQHGRVNGTKLRKVLAQVTKVVS